MFIATFASVHPGVSWNAVLDRCHEGTRELALEFLVKFLNNFPPAQIRGYLLSYRDSAADAAANISRWVEVK